MIVQVFTINRQAVLSTGSLDYHTGPPGVLLPHDLLPLLNGADLYVGRPLDAMDEREDSSPKEFGEQK